MIADIINLVAPASAAAGETGIVDVSVRNLSSFDQYIAVSVLCDSTLVPFQFDYLLVAPGQTVIFGGKFTMPSKSVRVTADSYYWDGSKWVYDDTASKDITLTARRDKDILTELTPEFSGFGLSDYSKF